MVRTTKSSLRRRNIRAAEDTDVEEEEQEAPEAPVVEEGFMFDPEDVADLLSEVTDEDVDVSIDDEENSVVFTVGEDEYTLEPDNSEVLEMTRMPKRVRKVNASRRAPARTRRVVASSRPVNRTANRNRSRVVRRIPR